MATYTPSWTTGVSLRTSTSISNGSNLTDTINLVSAGPYYQVDVQVSFEISSGSPSGDLLIEVFDSVDGGTAVDTEPVSTRRISFTATGTKLRTLEGLRCPHVTLKYTNNTGVSGNVVVKYAGMKQSSA